jgi:hypothetical protein
MEQFNKDKLCVTFEYDHEGYDKLVVKYENDVLGRFVTQDDAKVFCNGFIAATGKFGTMKGGSDE